MSAFSWGVACQPSAGVGQVSHQLEVWWVIQQLEVGHQQEVGRVIHHLEVGGSSISWRWGMSAISWKRAGQLSAGDVSPPARPRLFAATHFVTPGDQAMLNTGVFLS